MGQQGVEVVGAEVSSSSRKITHSPRAVARPVAAGGGAIGAGALDEGVGGPEVARDDGGGVSTSRASATTTSSRSCTVCARTDKRGRGPASAAAGGWPSRWRRRVQRPWRGQGGVPGSYRAAASPRAELAGEPQGIPAIQPWGRRPGCPDEPSGRSTRVRWPAHRADLLCLDGHEPDVGPAGAGAAVHPVANGVPGAAADGGQYPALAAPEHPSTRPFRT